MSKPPPPPTEPQPERPRRRHEGRVIGSASILYRPFPKPEKPQEDPK